MSLFIVAVAGLVAVCWPTRAGWTAVTGLAGAGFMVLGHSYLGKHGWNVLAGAVLILVGAVVLFGAFLMAQHA
jgi:hypothetical protein